MNDINPDIERLMIDALDGTITRRDKKALAEYLTHHQVEQAEFNRMVRVESAIRSDPMLPTAPAFSQRVMGAVWQSRVAYPALRLPQIVFLVGIASIGLTVTGIIATALYSLVSPSFPFAEIDACVALFKAIVNIGASALNVIMACVRAVYSQPVSWVVSVVLAAMVAFWVRLVLKLWMPGTPIMAS